MKSIIQNKIIKTYQIPIFANIKKLWTKEKKFDTKKLVSTSNDRINFQQQKNFDVLNISNVNSLSINNKVLKRDMGSQTENKIEFSKSQQIEFADDDVDSSNSVCGLNACCDWIRNTCG